MFWCAATNEILIFKKFILLLANYMQEAAGNVNFVIGLYWSESAYSFIEVDFFYIEYFDENY